MLYLLLPTWLFITTETLSKTEMVASDFKIPSLMESFIISTYHILQVATDVQIQSTLIVYI